MERIRSDSEDVSTHDGTVVRHGAMRSQAVAVPEGTVPTGEVLRISLGGDTHHGQFISVGDDERCLGVYATPDMARSGDGDDRLGPWLEAAALDVGRTVHVDVVVEDFKYGFRAPGETVVYDVPARPDESLSSIAAKYE